ncbi:hypothetical protein SARC_00408 [Sphaeroforma arctica JP610]|uniref:START domain-containing protein n=1 Tax=Sphaeroforma arctica JP610 TaxID=667725 RepID=A0A0L0GGL7_9EUKA|nr:hypothetical protein SARC_00408 [Sphaeroforma arctica JP610]KNC87473.1 hypothetical protein SARC_00408 [Sphaeroforma arctica JP610]|eukprot:XP_014161375.1 hypothetical protein SARC_00408 [Sphaeroforma arctica JP610]
MSCTTAHAHELYQLYASHLIKRDIWDVKRSVMEQRFQFDPFAPQISCAGIHEHHKILDDLGDEMVVINQAYTRLWPAAQRDCTYLTSRRRVDDTDIYAVINYSVNHPDDHIPASFVRASAEVGMVCESVIRPQCTETSLDALTRQDIQTKIYYQAKISPGGWVPAAVVRETSKREYPKFLHQLGKGCTEHFSDRPLDCSTVKKAFESRPPPAE